MIIEILCFADMLKICFYSFLKFKPDVGLRNLGSNQYGSKSEFIATGQSGQNTRRYCQEKVAHNTSGTNCKPIRVHLISCDQ